MKFIKNIIYSVLALEEKFLRVRLNKTLRSQNSSKRKKIFKDGCLLSLDSVAEETKNQMEQELLLILKQADYEPEKLLEYVKNQGTGVFYIPFLKPLDLINENEGFIYPYKGLKAFWLSLFTDKKFRFKTDEMFVLRRGDINKFYFVYHFYNWYSFKHGISGMDSDNLALLNRYLFNSTEEEIRKLQLEDIYKLKDAIKQDKASIEFVLKLCRDMEGAKKAFDKLLDDGASI